SQTVTPTLPKSQGPEASRALSKKRKQPKPKKIPNETKVLSPKPTKGSKQSHSVSYGTRSDPQDLKRNIQLASIGLLSTLDEGTHKSQPFLKGKAKTTLFPERSLKDKDSGGNKPPTDMEPINPTVVDPLGTGAKYQGSRILKPYNSTFADVQALLLSDDEMVQESDEEEVFEAGEDMDEDTQADTKVQSPLPNTDKPESYHVQDTDESTSDFSPDLKKFDNMLPLAERQLVKFLRKAAIEGYYEENIDHVNS
ncbi:hypothetical protein Tco_0235790, partial [Tanacetum coccineum]